MAKWLSKTDYVKRYLISPAYLWLYKHAPEKLPPVDDALQARFDQGNQITDLAQKLFPGGKLIAEDTVNCLEPTQKAMEKGGAIFEAATLANDRIFARTDVIKKNGGDWDLYEVKMGTNAKPEYCLDLAFQRLAWEHANVPVGRQYLILVDRRYHRQGEIEPEKLLKIEDVTGVVEGLLDQTWANIPNALKVIDSSECPDPSPLACDNLTAWLPIYEFLEGGLPDESIYRLSRLSVQAFREMNRLGYKLVTDIEHPDQFKLSPIQRGFWQAALNKAPTIHHQKIAHFLNKLEFPLYFFDYETVFPAVPLFDGIRPYEQVPFQYSLHILDKNGKLEHRSFLHKGTDNPSVPLLAKLRQDIRTGGSLIAWNKFFEIQINNDLAFKYPEFAAMLKSFNARMMDLMEVFSNQFYVDAGFLGSASLKNVLPVLVPELSYKDLAIGDGDLASSKWHQVVDGRITGKEVEQVYKDLEEYCAQDTLAMVKIYQFLVDLCKNPTAQLPF